MQIDNKVFDLNVTVKKHNRYDGGYTYTLFLTDNKKIGASPAQGAINPLTSQAKPLSNNSISQSNNFDNNNYIQNSENYSVENGEKLKYSVKPTDAINEKTLQSIRDISAEHGVDKNNDIETEYINGNNSDDVIFIKFNAKNSDNFSNNSSVKEQIKKYANVLNDLKPVFNDYVYVDNRRKTLNKEWVLNILKDTGYRVFRKNLGTVILDKKRISKSLSYLLTDGELAAYSALPHVLKNGIDIGEHENHKARGYITYTIAAHVIINGERGNMAVVVRRNDGNLYYKAHRIVMPDGSQFVYKKKQY